MIGGFGRALSLIGAGLLATVLFVMHPGFAFAQDVTDGDAEVVEQPDASIPNISGCWQGNVFNDSQANTLVTFFFKQTGHKISKTKSTIDLESNVPIHGPIKGTVSATGFKAKGHVAAQGISQGCNIKVTAFSQNDGTYTGNFRYVGFCFDNQFTGGEFSKLTFLGLTCQ